MMTVEEKLAMYRRKRDFVNCINLGFQTRPFGSTVDFIEYEVYEKDFSGEPFFNEWLVVHFFGGGKSVCVVTGNSDITNFKVLATMVDGGLYEENPMYGSLEPSGFKRVKL